MQENKNIHDSNGTGAVQLLKRLFNLKTDTDKVGTIELINSNVEFQSANAWTLVFAILIASVGLNLNSAAVIIGAMLISPLMGPIVGVGFALGVYDFALLKKSTKNLAAAVFISIVASTIYFILSPLSEVQSELLARTRPSFFDVLIAFFGGAAGIVAISRKEKSNAIPGVAIATALMPPLCTAGFGLATQNFSYFFGALYLFVINSVFISISTFIFVRYLGFYKSTDVESAHRKKINRWITYVGIVVLIPSFFMAWYLQRESFFKSQANKYIAQELRSERSLVLESEIVYNFKNPKIKVALLGEPLDDDELIILKDKAKFYSLSPESIEIRQSTFSESLEKKMGQKLSTTERASTELQIKLKQNEAELNSFKNLATLSKKVSEEMNVVFPRIVGVFVSKKNVEKSDKTIEVSVLVHWGSTPGKSDLAKASEFLSKRLSVDKAYILHLKGI
ncbi:MAG: TIGR00341 family protein [Deltaproteobacteria bacterium]|nr:TIGR00341 family protein [Deltaproteobacteria bacterium]